MATLLLIEDSPADRSQLRGVLQNARLFDRILEAEDGLSGIKLLLSERVDMVLSDLEMPGAGGDKVLVIRNSLGQNPPAPFLMLAEGNDYRRNAELMREGASDTGRAGRLRATRAPSTTLPNRRSRSSPAPPSPAGNARTFVGLSLPRYCRLSLHIIASSARATLTSAASAATSAVSDFQVEFAARRITASTPGSTDFHCSQIVDMSIVSPLVNCRSPVSRCARVPAGHMPE